MHVHNAAFGLVLLGSVAVIGIEGSSFSFAQMDYQGSSVQLDELVSSQVFTPPSAPSTLSSLRLTYDPGAIYEADFPGPIAIHVAAGTLAIKPDTKTTVGYQFVGTSDEGSTAERISPPELQLNERGETLLDPGWSITVPDGHLGQTRNPGQKPVVIFVAVLVPQPLYSNQGRHETIRVSRSDRRGAKAKRTDRQALLVATPVTIDP